MLQVYILEYLWPFLVRAAKRLSVQQQLELGILDVNHLEQSCSLRAINAMLLIIPKVGVAPTASRPLSRSSSDGGLKARRVGVGESTACAEVRKVKLE